MRTIKTCNKLSSSPPHSGFCCATASGILTPDVSKTDACTTGGASQMSAVDLDLGLLQSSGSKLWPIIRTVFLGSHFRRVSPLRNRTKVSRLELVQCVQLLHPAGDSPNESSRLENQKHRASLTQAVGPNQSLTPERQISKFQGESLSEPFCSFGITPESGRA